MNYARALLLALVAALLLAPPALAAKGFQLGVTPGEVTSSSAVLWGKATKSGKYSLEVARNGKFRGRRPSPWPPRRATTTPCRSASRASARTRSTGSDSSASTIDRLRRLQLAPADDAAPVAARHRARSKRSDVGTFRTAPKPKQNATIRFAWSGDQDFNSEPGKTTPYWNNGEVLSRMKAERNNFNVMLGDTIYSDSEVPGRSSRSR